MDAIHKNALRILVSFKDLTEFLGSSVDVEKYDELITSLEKIKLTSDDPLKSYIDCVRLLTGIQSLLMKLKSPFEDCESQSETFRLTYKAMVNKVTAKHLAFTKDVEEAKVAIVTNLSNDVFDEIAKKDNKLTAIDELRAKYHKHKELISIYANVMQRAIDEFFASERSLSFKLLEYISEDKQLALSGKYEQVLKKSVSSNPPQTRFGLLPMTSSMLLKDLLPIILAEEKITVSTDNIAQLAKKHSIGFIEMKSIIYTPVEYNVRPLVNANDAKQYIQPSEYGINEKTVERFKTLSTFGNINKWDFSIHVYTPNADHFYIIETLDGKTYRCLAPWLQSSRYSVAKFRAQKLLDYGKDNKPTKALEYHAYAQQQATKNMFLGKALALEDFDPKLTDIESGKIQANIADAVIEQVKVVMKSYKKSLDPIVVSDILHDRSIVETFISATEREFALDKRSFDGGKFPIAEIVSSFIVALQTASRRFAREVHNGYSRDPLKPKDFTDDHSANHLLASEKIDRVLRNAVELVIKLDENLFTSNYYKYLILNHTGK